MTTAGRPIFVVSLRAEPGVDPVPALKGALKVLLRAFGLKAISIVEKQREPSCQGGGK